ncbi:MAG: hypothetical protein HY231_19635 [Acidobacteria bacterium]|nr:hypothetical protein [Acidobacteriota bacterium]
MKKALKIMLLILGLLAVYPIVWIAASKGYLGEIEFGYYEEFNIAKHAIENSGCAKIEDQMANPDLELEEISFGLTTSTGQKIRVDFDASNMDVKQVCHKPDGLAVRFSGDAQGLAAQSYSIELLSNLLKGKNVKVTNLKDALCNMDELQQLFKANRTNKDIPRISFWDSRKHLHIFFEDE